MYMSEATLKKWNISLMFLNLGTNEQLKRSDFTIFEICKFMQQSRFNVLNSMENNGCFWDKLKKIHKKLLWVDISYKTEEVFSTC